MNKVNGYCQIELPERFNINALTSAPEQLTKEEKKPIIDKLGLGGVKLPEDQEERSASGFIDAIYKKIKDALVRKPAYIVIKRSSVDGDVITPSIITDEVEGSDQIIITAVLDKSTIPLYFMMNIGLTDLVDVEEVPTIYDVSISILARRITITNI